VVQTSDKIAQNIVQMLFSDENCINICR